MPRVSGLPAALAVKGRAFRHHIACFALAQQVHGRARRVAQVRDRALGRKTLVAHKGAGQARVQQRLEGIGPRSGLAQQAAFFLVLAGAGALRGHVGFKARSVGGKAAFFGHVRNNVQGEAISVVEFEAEVAGDARFARGLEGGQLFVQQLQAFLQREGKALLFLKHGAGDKIGMFRQFGIGVAHDLRDLAGHFVHEGLVYAHEGGKA